MRPKARSDDQLLLRQLPDELVVYDRRRTRVHCLNRAAAALWRKCDGQATIVQLAADLDLDADQRIREAIVSSGIDQLSAAGLLVESGADEAARPTRRDVLDRLVRVGTYAVLLPVVTSILAPTPAMAQSGLPDGSPCISSSQCSSGCCNTGSFKCVGSGNCLP